MELDPLVVLEVGLASQEVVFEWSSLVGVVEQMELVRFQVSVMRSVGILLSAEVLLSLEEVPEAAFGTQTIEGDSPL